VDEGTQTVIEIEKQGLPDYVVSTWRGLGERRGRTRMLPHGSVAAPLVREGCGQSL